MPAAGWRAGSRAAAPDRTPRAGSRCRRSRRGTAAAGRCRSPPRCRAGSGPGPRAGWRDPSSISRSQRPAAASTSAAGGRAGSSCEAAPVSGHGLEAHRVAAASSHRRRHRVAVAARADARADHALGDRLQPGYFTRRRPAQLRELRWRRHRVALVPGVDQPGVARPRPSAAGGPTSALPSSSRRRTYSSAGASGSRSSTGAHQRRTREAELAVERRRSGRRRERPTPSARTPGQPGPARRSGCRGRGDRSARGQAAHVDVVMSDQPAIVGDDVLVLLAVATASSSARRDAAKVRISSSPAAARSTSLASSAAQRLGQAARQPDRAVGLRMSGRRPDHR